MKDTLIRPIGRRNQVTIPVQLLRQVRLRSGDMVNFILREEGILLKPVAIVDKQEVWQEEDLRAIKALIDEQLKRGKYIDFDSPKKAVGFLKKKRKVNEG